MKYVVLFQHSCHACSKVARMVGDLSIADLEARPFGDPQITDLLSAAHLEITNRPSLLIIDNDDVEMVSGWAMRRRLAHVVGWRNSRAIVRLLAAEWRARLVKSAGSHSLSRRKVIGSTVAGTLAAVVGGKLAWPGPATGSPKPGTHNPRTTVADPAELEKVLLTASVQRSTRTWGPVGEAYKLSGEQPMFVLIHPQDEIVTFVDNSPGAARGGNPTALSLGKSPDATAVMRYYTTAGTPLADLAESNGSATVRPVPGGSTDTDPDGISTAQMYLFIVCCGIAANGQCAAGCLACVHNPGTICLIACAYCAGPAGIQCAKDIFGS